MNLTKTNEYTMLSKEVTGENGKRYTSYGIEGRFESGNVVKIVSAFCNNIMESLSEWV